MLAPFFTRVDALLLPLLLAMVRWFFWPPARTPDGASAKRILVLSLDGLGDSILAIPAIRATRRQWPAAQITLLVAPVTARLFRNCPDVDRILHVNPADFQWLLPRNLAIFRLFTAIRVSGELRAAGPYDVVIETRPFVSWFGSPFVAYLSGAPERIAVSCDQDYRRSQAEERLFPTIVTEPGVLHRAAYSRTIARRLWDQTPDDVIRLWPSAADHAWARQTLGGDTRPLVALGIGASSRGRQWPVERYLAVARSMPDSRFVVMGGPQDAARAERLVRAIGAGALHLCQEDPNRSAAALDLADAYFGNDTGTMHMAAACGVPCLIVSAHPAGAAAAHYQSPERYHPWQVRWRYMQAEPSAPECRTGCDYLTPHCILGVTAEDAARELKEFLRQGARSRRADSTADVGGSVPG